MNIEKFQEGGKTVTLYFSEKENIPLIILNTYSGNGDSVVEELRRLDSRLQSSRGGRFEMGS